MSTNPAKSASVGNQPGFVQALRCTDKQGSKGGEFCRDGGATQLVRDNVKKM
jgi:hypothetical protein